MLRQESTSNDSSEGAAPSVYDQENPFNEMVFRLVYPDGQSNHRGVAAYYVVVGAILIPFWIVLGAFGYALAWSTAEFGPAITMIIRTIIWILGLAITAYLGYRAHSEYRQRESVVKRSVQVDASIEETGQKIVNPKVPRSHFLPKVKFSYLFGGNIYTNDYIRPYNSTFPKSAMASAQNLADTIEDGHDGTAYVDPSNPEHAFLKPDPYLKRSIIAVPVRLFFIAFMTWPVSLPAIAIALGGAYT